MLSKNCATIGHSRFFKDHTIYQTQFCKDKTNNYTCTNIHIICSRNFAKIFNSTFLVLFYSLILTQVKSLPQPPFKKLTFFNLKNTYVFG